MSDYISRADALKELNGVCSNWQDDAVVATVIQGLPSAVTEVTEVTDLIRREDAMGAVQDHFNNNGFKGYDDGQKMMDRIKTLPSADRPIEEAKNNISRHPNCSMRTEIGNCDPIGGFCTSINENVCDALHKVSRPTRGRNDATEEDYHYCDDCEAVEMCMWYPYRECQFKVSRPTGEWKPIELKGYQYVTCNQCGLLADIVEKDGEFVMSMANADEKYANYCPNCGADMRGDNNETD